MGAIAQPDLEETARLSVVTEEKAAGTRKRRRLARIRFDASTWVYIGIALAVGGLGLIGLAWGRVAGLLHVGLQIPYLISAGVTGLALVAVGIGLAHFGAQHRDATERVRELNRIAGLLEQVADELRAVAGSEEEEQR